MESTTGAVESREACEHEEACGVEGCCYDSRVKNGNSVTTLQITCFDDSWGHLSKI